MSGTVKSMRLQIAFFGRTNTGKSSLINLLAGQDVAITSPVAGTTTDTVEKAMELAPVGPVLLIDTAGLDDDSVLGKERIKRTNKVFERADIAVLAATPNIWGETEEMVAASARKHNIKLITVINKCDTAEPDSDFLETVSSNSQAVLQTTALPGSPREKAVNDFRNALLKNLPESFQQIPPLAGDLLQPGELAVLIVPLDIAAPKGRLIMPQVQAIRDILDHNAMTLVVKEDRYPELIKKLNPRPALVICDSQVVKMMIENTPSDIPCTTFSVLFSRLKGDTKIFMQGCQAIKTLQDNDKVLIAEACTHHPTCEDIGRVKLPMMLKKATGKTLDFTFAPGRDYPENIDKFKLIIHCGSCMLNRKETLWRIEQARQNNIPITNYGMAISWCQGVLEKVLIPE
ncbi:MAG: [FeFe] hydrogenase H-cluster maturation GTPase HydF [Lentisphaeria bacterium]|nr:[FeFe] hydrogenase H-cluster maturation GTPase HydF [Lentisphaeria bacterium]